MLIFFFLIISFGPSSISILQDSEELKWTCQPPDDECKPTTNHPTQPVVSTKGQKYFGVGKSSQVHRFSLIGRLLFAFPPPPPPPPPPKPFIVEEWCQQWHVLLNSLDLSEVVCMRNLLSLSNADQVCGIMASVMMARATPTAPPQEETALAIGRRTMQELCRLLLSDTERVRVCAALALYCLDMHVEKVLVRPGHALHDLSTGVTIFSLLIFHPHFGCC